MMLRWRLALAATALLVAGVGGALLLARAATPAHALADADDLALVMHGKTVYRQACASCHGRELQGQSLWQLKDAYQGRRAPALDDSGPAWHRADTDLMFMTEHGRFPGADTQAPSFMPAFSDRLAGTDIVAVVAFIKARWPVGLRVLQASLNPGEAGMPRLPGDADWRFPPDCIPMRGQRRTGVEIVGRAK
jgi:mono/diheme cytochrome c family protein